MRFQVFSSRSHYHGRVCGRSVCLGSSWANLLPLYTALCCWQVCLVVLGLLCVHSSSCPSPAVFAWFSTLCLPARMFGVSACFPDSPSSFIGHPAGSTGELNSFATSRCVLTVCIASPLVSILFQMPGWSLCPLDASDWFPRPSDTPAPRLASPAPGFAPVPSLLLWATVSCRTVTHWPPENGISPPAVHSLSAGDLSFDSLISGRHSCSSGTRSLASVHSVPCSIVSTPATRSAIG